LNFANPTTNQQRPGSSGQHSLQSVPCVVKELVDFLGT
jgi:hypothetical protein